MSRRTLVLAIVALCFAVSSFVWGEKCKRVNIARGSTPVYFFDPAECDGYDACGYWELYGTHNGTYWIGAYWDDVVEVSDDTIAATRAALPRRITARCCTWMRSSAVELAVTKHSLSPSISAPSVL